MYCIECGNKIEDDAKFCSKCGRKVTRNKDDIGSNYSIELQPQYTAISNSNIENNSNFVKGIANSYSEFDRILPEKRLVESKLIFGTLAIALVVSIIIGVVAFFCHYLFIFIFAPAIAISAIVTTCCYAKVKKKSIVSFLAYVILIPLVATVVYIISYIMLFQGGFSNNEIWGWVLWIIMMVFNLCFPTILVIMVIVAITSGFKLRDEVDKKENLSKAKVLMSDYYYLNKGIIWALIIFTVLEVSWTAFSIWYEYYPSDKSIKKENKVVVEEQYDDNAEKESDSNNSDKNNLVSVKDLITPDMTEGYLSDNIFNIVEGYYEDGSGNSVNIYSSGSIVRIIFKEGAEYNYCENICAYKEMTDGFFIFVQCGSTVYTYYYTVENGVERLYVDIKDRWNPSTDFKDHSQIYYKVGSEQTNELLNSLNGLTEYQHITLDDLSQMGYNFSLYYDHTNPGVALPYELYKLDNEDIYAVVYTFDFTDYSDNKEKRVEMFIDNIDNPEDQRIYDRAEYLFNIYQSVDSSSQLYLGNTSETMIEGELPDTIFESIKGHYEDEFSDTLDILSSSEMTRFVWGGHQNYTYNEKICGYQEVTDGIVIFIEWDEEKYTYLYTTENGEEKIYLNTTDDWTPYMDNFMYDFQVYVKVQ